MEKRFIVGIGRGQTCNKGVNGVHRTSDGHVR